jgi:elongation factor P
MEEIAGEAPYLTESLEGVQAMIYNDECVGLQLPTSVELRVVECDPGVKGNSATSRNKPAKLETGLIVQVPEYLTQGELIKVDTRTGDFLSRA